jgi:hypothetical protein
MDQEMQAKLRAPFPPEQVAKRPQLTCRDCVRSPQRCCAEHRKARCTGCGQWMTGAHIDLDYVGHADLTHRLLEVDPNWNWEPLARDEDGLPLIDGQGGMWIKLTVGDVTRLGYGDASGKDGPNAVKEIIGDALRNAGMRFGMALDLWRKESTPPQETAAKVESEGEPSTETGSGDSSQTSRRAGLLRKQIANVAKTKGYSAAEATELFGERTGKAVDEASLVELSEFSDWLRKVAPAKEGEERKAAS